MTNKPPTTRVNCPRFSSVSSLVLKFDSRLLSLNEGPPVSGRPSMAATSRFALLYMASLYFSSVAKTAVTQATILVSYSLKNNEVITTSWEGY